MNDHKVEVKDFFNQISSTYRDKYTPQQAFHHYFFVERLRRGYRRLGPIRKARMRCRSRDGKFIRFPYGTF